MHRSTIVRIASAVLMIATALVTAPARAADLATAWAAPVHAEPLVVYDYEPGIVVRTYWLGPWGGRHYFPSSDKRPVLGRREQLVPAAVSDRTYRRSWSSGPIDTIQQPPLILNQQQFFPSGETTPPPVPK
jgi:hypothetical protein